MRVGPISRDATLLPAKIAPVGAVARMRIAAPRLYIGALLTTSNVGKITPEVTPPTTLEMTRSPASPSQMPSKTSGADTWSKSAISQGHSVRLVRTELYVGSLERRGLTQPELYNMCRVIESNLAPAPQKKRRSFAEVSFDRAKKKIRKIEAKPDSAQNPFELIVIARAMQLPDNFFARPFDTKSELLAAFQSKDRDAAADSRSTPQPPQEVLIPLRHPVGFPRISHDEPLPQSRRDAASKLSSQLTITNPVRSQLILLQGRTGVGKTFFVGHWFRDYGRSVFQGNSLRIDCTTNSLDQIIPAVEQHFVSTPVDSQPATIPEALAANSSNLIVLDGLKLEQFGEGPVPAGIVRTRRPALRDLAELVASILNFSRNTVIIACIENNSRPISDAIFVRALDERVNVMTLIIPALSDKEGADFLNALGVTLMDERRRELISARLHGMPMALAAAALELSRLTDAERETYLDWVPDTPTTGPEDDFVRFFRTYVDRIEAMRPPHGQTHFDPHPHAFLRLLALM